MADTYDLDRLEELRDRHRVTLADYRRASGAVQEAVKALAQLRAAAALVAPQPPAVAARGGSPWPVTVMRERKRPVADITDVREVPPSPPPSRVEQQISAAVTRLARLTTERDKLTSGVRQSSAFAARLEEFAKVKNL